jgi:hypothetical protein
MATRICSVKVCSEKHYARDYCYSHYSWSKGNDWKHPTHALNPHYSTPAEALAYRVDETPEGCLLWTGRKDLRGYGKIRASRRTRLAHRVAYELAKGPIPAGLTIDHLCETPSCVNPDHMEPCTTQENSRRSAGNNRAEHLPVGWAGA